MFVTYENIPQISSKCLGNQCVNIWMFFILFKIEGKIILITYSVSMGPVIILTLHYVHLQTES